jgi:hypothetical protein
MRIFKSASAAAVVLLLLASCSSNQVHEKRKTSSVDKASFSCEPSTSSDNQVLNLHVDFVNKRASIVANETVYLNCQDNKFTQNGDIFEYGEAKLAIQCHTGLVSLINDYDELRLDISKEAYRADKKFFADHEYICEED